MMLTIKKGTGSIYEIYCFGLGGRSCKNKLLEQFNDMEKYSKYNTEEKKVGYKIVLFSMISITGKKSGSGVTNMDSGYLWRV